jgi:hypothetical protein
MNPTTLHALAVKLQQRRAEPPTLSFYLQQNGKRHLLFIALYSLLAAAAFAISNYWLASVIIAFAVGRQTRDLEWYRTLTRDWPLTEFFVDWKKVDDVAQSPSPLQGS